MNAWGVNHVEITAAILADCGIPKKLAEPIYYYVAPDLADFTEDPRPYQLTQLRYQTKHMADLGLASEAGRHNEITGLLRLGGKIGLDAESFGELPDRAVRQWHKWSELLKVLTNPLPIFCVMASTPPPCSTPGKPNSSSKRVVMVEDEPTARIMTKGMLSQILGCEAYTAENGKGALSLALKAMPPVMDSLEFCHSLRTMN